MRALILGRTGMLGSDLVSNAPTDVVIWRGSPQMPRLEITDPNAVQDVLTSFGPEIVINAAAYTKVDEAEANRALADAVNGTAVGNLAAACASHGIPIVHFSTDYVFPGSATRPYREEDPVSPLNAYGSSKLFGERALQASTAEFLILRTQWLFGLAGRSFPRTMWERALRRVPTRVVSDQFGRPTYTRDLAVATWDLVGTGARGIVHVANTGETSWFEVAKRVFTAAGVPLLVSPCTSAEYPTPARRPGYSVLDTSRFVSIAGYTLPYWTDALESFLGALSGN